MERINLKDKEMLSFSGAPRAVRPLITLGRPTGTAPIPHRQSDLRP